MRRRTISPFSEDGNVEPGIILFYVAGPVFIAKLLNHGRNLFGVRDWSGLEFSLSASGIDSNRRIVQNILVPSGLRSLHGHEVQLVVVHGEPDRD